MSDIIQLLPDSVANQIAAGEVIQRPANVVKELVENAIDAGATAINVLVVDAGRTSIQVIDNGKGMSDTDARMSFERHATSKIRQASDLFQLHTMGFRGEALASIAAVAQVELRTRTEGEDIGTHISIEASEYKGQEPCSCPVGSNFMVENLFYNVPARRKFLKANSTEMNNIIAAFERIVLVNPQLAFTLHSNGTELFNLKPQGLRQRIVDVFGRRINANLLPVKADTTICKISGFVGKPEASRKKSAQQYFFVNGRYMKHPYFNKAVMTAYERLVPMGEQVPYFIYFEVPADNIDVNIHPTKTEIKFENEQAVWQILAAAVKETIGMFNDVPSIDFDTQGRPDIPAFDEASGASLPKVQYNPSYNPFNDSPSAPRNDNADNWQQLYDGLEQQSEPEAATLFGGENTGGEADSEPADSAVAEKSPAHYQYKGMYVMTAVKSGLMVVDQHRAHTRILYDRYLKQIEAQRPVKQTVLFPEALHFTPVEDAALQDAMPSLESLGFELTPLGACAYSLNSVPAGIEGVNFSTLLHDMVSPDGDDGSSAVADINHRVALRLARNAAVAYGQVLTNAEMESLVNDLFACSNFNYTPDGKKITCILPQTEIEHLLG